MTRVARILFLAALCLVAAEGAARAFWRIHFGVPVAHPDKVLYAFYPLLAAVDREHVSRSADAYDVLLLGGSVLHKDWGEVEAALSEQLASAGHHDVRLFNLAEPAHTSRDSLLKYAALAEARFNLVVVYDGINDARLNAAPPEIFREDYGHNPWYEVVNAMAPYHGHAIAALPYTLRYLAIRAEQAARQARYIPRFAPRLDWMEYGRESRSVGPFEHHLDAILGLAAARGDRVMLMTFATYVPRDYSLDAFMAHRLDYVLHANPIEMWGRKNDVLATVSRQNDVVRRLAARHHDALFVDQAALMTAGAQAPYFNDVCHLTIAGSVAFAGHVADAMIPALGSR